ncbi:sigma-54-dependent Fis family transcriptional regulator [candidate division KSB1 bacterium]|nr:sigma-54-dependent Fis family transcriptional regulator [candidate division KSB1 bacterium]
MKGRQSKAMLEEVLVGNCPEINRTRKSLLTISHHKQHVLIVGEAGTEKIKIAQLLYSLSDSEPLLIETNAARLNSAFEHEVWSQIEKGLQTPIQQKKISGILIVEDVDQLDEEVQKKLAIFAKRGFYRFAGKDVAIETDFRLITTGDIQWLTSENRNHFNSELFLALSELTIKIPPLRERRQDIPLLFENILKQVCEDLGHPVPAINFEVFNQMLKYEWPGNIKEMTNVARTAVLASPESELIPQALPFYNHQHQFTRIELQSLGLAVARLEKEMIEGALLKFAGNQSRAAEALNISEANLRFKMKKMGLSKRDFVPQL